MTRAFLAAALFTVTGATLIATYPTAATLPTDMSTAKAGQGFIEDVGATHLIGYFVPDNGNCAVTVMMSERVDPDLAPGAGTAMKMNLEPGAIARVVDGSGPALHLTCGADAASLIVVPTTAPKA